MTYSSSRSTQWSSIRAGCLLEEISSEYRRQYPFGVSVMDVAFDPEWPDIGHRQPCPHTKRSPRGCGRYDFCNCIVDSSVHKSEKEENIMNREGGPKSGGGASKSERHRCFRPVSFPLSTPARYSVPPRFGKTGRLSEATPLRMGLCAGGSICCPVAPGPPFVVRSRLPDSIASHFAVAPVLPSLAL